MYSSDYTAFHYRPLREERSKDRHRSFSFLNARNADAQKKDHATTDDYANNATSNRRQRYTRSSTSVAQLLSDSCSNLFQKLTTRVRGSSTTTDNNQNHDEHRTKHANPFVGSNPLSTSKSSTAVPSYGLSARARLEDKYSSVLDKIWSINNVRKYETRDDNARHHQAPARGLMKSSTTTNVLLSEKHYPYVNAPREKTPFREIKRPTLPNQISNVSNYQHSNYQPWRRAYPEPPYSYLDRDSAYRVRQRSNHSELRPRRTSKPHRTGKSEVSDRKSNQPSNKLCSVDISLRDDDKPVAVHNAASTSNCDDKATAAALAEPPLSERDVKRKEIQSLIKKYTALDDFYSKFDPLAPEFSAAALDKPDKAHVKHQTQSAAPHVVVPNNNNNNYVGRHSKVQKYAKLGPGVSR